MNAVLNTKVSEEVERWFTEHAKDPIYVLEANSYEFSAVWTRFKDVISDDSRGGYLLTVGHIGTRPIVISVSAFRVHGAQVLRYEPTSQLVDYVAIEQWLKHRYPNLLPDDGYHYSTDASNFHNVAHYALQKTIDQSGLK